MRSIFALLLALATTLGGAGAASAHRTIVPPQAGGYDLELVCEGERCDEVVSRGQRWIVGEHGRRYTLALVNRTDAWVEAVVAVDGRSVIDGRSISSGSRGYLVPPRERVEIEGWRVSSSDVAAFRFTSVGDSYVGRMGDASQAGVVRVDFYPERAPVWVAPPEESWHDHDDGMRPSPRTTDKHAPRGEASAVWDGERERQDLGTRYGERRWQPISERPFERANGYPSRSLTLRYDDRAGLVARGVLRSRWDDEPRWVPPPRPRIDDDARPWVPPPPGSWRDE